MARRPRKRFLPQVIFRLRWTPKRDTPEQLAKYVPYFDPGFIGLTAADQPSIEAHRRQNWVSGSSSSPPPTAITPSIIPAPFFVLNPDGRLTAVLTGPFSVGRPAG